MIPLIFILEFFFDLFGIFCRSKINDVFGIVFLPFFLRFGLHSELILGYFLMFFRSEGSLGVKNVIFTKTHVLLSFFNDFEGPRGPKSCNFWSRGRLFRGPETESIFSSIFEAKSAKNELILAPFGT